MKKNIATFMSGLIHNCSRSRVRAIMAFCLLVVGSVWCGWGSGEAQYQDEYLVAVGSNKNSLSNEVENFKNTDTLRQSFLVRPQDPLAREVLLQYICLSSYYWAGSDAKITLNVYEGGINDNGILLYSEPLNLKRMVSETGFTFPEGISYHMVTDSFGEVDPDYSDIQYINTEGGLPLKVDSVYTFAIIADSISVRDYGFYCIDDDYSDGESGTPDRDIWFKLIGRVDSDADSGVVYENISTNSYFFDTYSHQFPDKLVGVGTTELIKITHSKAGSFAYEVENSSIVSLTVNQSAGTETVALYGLVEGKTRVFVKNGSDTLSYFYVSVKNRRRIDLSFSYINYPGEHDHPLRHSYTDVADKIIALYDSINVEIHFTDNGNLEYDWDFNNDSLSYTPDRIEAWSPIDSSIIPDQERYFSSLYIIRESKSLSDEKQSQTGGGTSRGMGSGDFPRAAYKRVHLNNVSHTVTSTLQHELGHNLGLTHYTKMNTMYYPTPYSDINLMKSGRSDSKIFGFQWDIVHQTIRECADNGEVYDDKTALETSDKKVVSSVVVTLRQNSLIVTGVSQGATVQLFNLRGQLLYSIKLENTNNKINLPSLSSQCVLSVVTDRGIVQQIKRIHLQ